MNPRLDRDDVRAAGFLTIKGFRRGKLVRAIERIPNKVVASSGGYGRNLITRQLAGETLYPLAIDSVSLGTGNTAAADGDTDLQTPTVTGITISNISISNDVLQVDVFIADGDLPDDTYKEFGIFCGGRLLARILISPTYTKSSGEDPLFSYQLTISG
jgi:hypothetical protein